MKQPTDENSQDDDQRLGDHLRAHATRFDAGDALRASIRTQLALRIAAQPLPRDLVSIGGLTLAWRSTAVGLIGGIVVTLAFGLALGPQIEALVVRPSLERGLVSRHVYSMGQGPLFDVASSDRHTIKPWFQGKLDFAPPVPDLTPDHFPLLGGRVDHIDDNTVAALAYAHNRHIVNVFVWPSALTQAPKISTYRGFNLNHWSDGTMQVWVVSDADAAEVERFGNAWRKHASGSP